MTSDDITAGKLLFIPPVDDWHKEMSKCETGENSKEEEEPKEETKEGETPEGTPDVDYSKEAFPVLYVHCKNPSDVICVFFHSYQDDLKLVSEDMKKLSRNLNCHVISPEYPGMGICFAEPMLHTELVKRSERLINFLTDCCNFEKSNMIIVSRKQGAEVAIQMAAEHNCALLTLIEYEFQKLDHAEEGIGFVPTLKEDEFVKTDKISCPILLINKGKKTTTKIEKAIEFKKYIAKNKGKNYVHLHIVKDKKFEKLDISKDISVPLIEFSMKIAKGPLKSQKASSAGPSSKDQASGTIKGLVLGPREDTPNEEVSRPLLTDDKLIQPSRYYQKKYLESQFDRIYHASLCCCIVQ
ncbi:unnamed protein product [Moneuplotes crassus]|uniref:Uncharacterized protein n=1 Tax=Euplotes crassus TaxID=5936 RepID=A0AAD1XCZ5_EUPCR|nr:unnamed protein product [Moneuplotes crassus]